MIALARLQRFGHTPIAIAGGGTGMIGDPSGKTNERSLLSLEEIERNLEGIKPQLARFLDFDAAPNAARIVNNADWLCTVGLMPFLRDVGKYFTVNYMLQKESIKRRLESEEGLSYTEFSYLLAQSWDFVQLFDRYGCTLQLGGSDQWGNITAGIDLVRKIRGQKVHALVMPLDHDRVGRQVRQDRGGHDLARSGAHVAVPVLSVLAEHRRPRRRHVSEVLHVSRARRDRGDRARGGRRAGEARSAEGAGARGDDARARRRRARARGGGVGRAVRRGHRDAAASTMCWRCSSDVPSTNCRGAVFDGDGVGDRRSARAAGREARAVEERSAAPRAVGRRVREQPARVGSCRRG